MEFKMIVGLGNPGPEYEHTYHNCGALMVDYLLRDRQPTWKHEASYSFAREGNLLYIKPTTFMNESGRAVREAAQYYKVPSEHIVVIQDDADIELGEFKLRPGGGTGGHRGVASVLGMMDGQGAIPERGNEDNKIWRLKIGIRRTTEETREKALDIVLRAIGTAEKEVLYGVFAKAEKVLLNVIENEMP